TTTTPAETTKPTSPATPPASQKTATQKPTEAEIDAMFQKARTAFWQRQFPAAIADYDTIEQDQPENAGAWGEQGNVYLASGNRPMAAKAFEKAAQLRIKQGADCAQIQPMLPWIAASDAKSAQSIAKSAHCPGS
ncbi:MAG: hypothetical protein ACP5RC_08980, partial [Halothiobacillaceae bacterium]